MAEKKIKLSYWKELWYRRHNGINGKDPIYEPNTRKLNYTISTISVVSWFIFIMVLVVGAAIKGNLENLPGIFLSAIMTALIGWNQFAAKFYGDSKKKSLESIKFGSGMP